MKDLLIIALQPKLGSLTFLCAISICSFRVFWLVYSLPQCSHTNLDGLFEWSDLTWRSKLHLSLSRIKMSHSLVDMGPQNHDKDWNLRELLRTMGARKGFRSMYTANVLQQSMTKKSIVLQERWISTDVEDPYLVLVSKSTPQISQSRLSCLCSLSMMCFSKPFWLTKTKPHSEQTCLGTETKYNSKACPVTSTFKAF